MKKLQTITLFLIVLLMSCDKDDNPSNNTQNPGPDPSAFAENFGSEIQRNFLGSIIDTDRNPIEGVTITIGNKTAMTDANGIFIINDANVNERFGYVKASKQGYLHGSRSLVPSSGTNKVTIMLLPETVAGSTNSGTAETIALPNGASVALQGDYIKADGSSYSGSVNVIMHHLDPADEDMKDQMPGMLYAANAQNQERMLQTFGMLAVELRGSGGEQLNIAEGSSAEIKVPLDASLMADAPSTIPLWHFDEEYGYWMEDGEATLVGNAYVGTVTHFSFWNCDIPAEAFTLCVTVLDSDNIPLAYTYVFIESSIYGTTSGVTNENGEVCGFVPSNETLNINVSDFTQCGLENLYEGTVGPFSDDASITVNAIDNGTYITQTVVGNFTTCNGDPVNDGYVALHYNGVQHYASMVDSAFEFNLISCSTNNTFYLYGVDYENIQETDSIAYTFTPPITNVGTLATCNTVEEFITYQVNDNSPVFFTSTDILGAGLATASSFNITAEGNNGIFVFLIPSTFSGVGSYTYLDDEVSLYFSDDVNGINNAMFGSSIIFNITSYGNVGEYIDVNFSGSYSSQNFGDASIIGTIHVLRSQ